MRRTIILLFVIIALSGCMTRAATLSVKPAFSITKTEISDIDGNYTFNELIVHKRSGLSKTEVVTIGLNKYPDGKVKIPMMVVYLNTSNWVFPENLAVKVNGETFRMEHTDMLRDVIGANNLSEIYFYLPPDRLIELLKNAQSISLQIGGGGVIHIPETGMAPIQSFVNQLN